MSKFTPMFPKVVATPKEAFTSGRTFEHACTACGTRHSHSGQMVVNQWCKECSAISMYKAVSNTILPANVPRQMITVMV